MLQLTLGESIRLYRRRAGLSQKELAQFIGVEDSSISRVESGERLLTRDSLSRLITTLSEQFPFEIGVEVAADFRQLAEREEAVNRLVKRLRPNLSSLIRTLPDESRDYLPSLIDHPSFLITIQGLLALPDREARQTFLDELEREVVKITP